MLNFIVYLIWGCGFAPSPGGGVIQAVATVPIIVYWCIRAPKEMASALFKRPVGILACVGTSFACVSAYLYGYSLASLFHYLMLVPAFAVLLVTCSREERRRQAEAGLSLAAFIFCGYHAAFTDFSRISDFSYRQAGEFSFNPNVVAFVACMDILAHASLWFREHKKYEFNLRSAYHCVAIILGAYVLFMTRCRGALLACIIGLFSLAYFCSGARMRHYALSVLFCTSVTIFIWSAAIMDLLDRYYGVFTGARSADTFSHRSAAWAYSITTTISKDIFLGTGPQEWDTGTSLVLGANSPHDGFLYFFTQIGLLGTIPYLLIFIFVFFRINQDWDIKKYYAPLFIAGFFETLVESYFFSLGNPGLLLFLFSVVVLIQKKENVIVALARKEA